MDEKQIKIEFRGSLGFYIYGEERLARERKVGEKYV